MNKKKITVQESGKMLTSRETHNVKNNLERALNKYIPNEVRVPSSKYIRIGG